MLIRTVLSCEYARWKRRDSTAQCCAAHEEQKCFVASVGVFSYGEYGRWKRTNFIFSLGEICQCKLCVCVVWMRIYKNECVWYEEKEKQPLHYSAKLKTINKNLLTVLLAHKNIPVNIWDNWGGTPLSILNVFNYDGKDEIFSLLMKKCGIIYDEKTFLYYNYRKSRIKEYSVGYSMLQSRTIIIILRIQLDNCIWIFISDNY